MRKTTGAAIDFSGKQYQITLMPEEELKSGYEFDGTVFSDIPHLELSQLSLRLAQDKTEIFLTGPAFLSTLHYAAELRTQHPSAHLHLVVMDINFFVIDCWEILKKILAASQGAAVALTNDEIAHRFSLFLSRKFHDRFKGEDQTLRSRDAHHISMSNENLKLEVSDPLLKLLNQYGITLLSSIVSEALVFYANYQDESNALAIQDLIKNNPRLLSMFYVSNMVELTYLLGSAGLLPLSRKEIQRIIDAKLLQLLRPSYEVSIHLYTRLDLKAERRLPEQLSPNKILVVYGNSPNELLTILRRQLDTLFLQKFQPAYPSARDLDTRTRELSTICLLRDNELLPLPTVVVSELPTAVSASIPQNRHSTFSLVTTTAPALVVHEDQEIARSNSPTALN